MSPERDTIRDRHRVAPTIKTTTFWRRFFDARWVYFLSSAQPFTGWRERPSSVGRTFLGQLHRTFGGVAVGVDDWYLAGTTDRWFAIFTGPE